MTAEATEATDETTAEIARLCGLQDTLNLRFRPPNRDTITGRFQEGCWNWVRKAGSLFTRRWSKADVYREAIAEVQDAYSHLTACAEAVGEEVDPRLVRLCVWLLWALDFELVRVEKDERAEECDREERGECPGASVSPATWMGGPQ